MDAPGGKLTRDDLGHYAKIMEKVKLRTIEVDTLLRTHKDERGILYAAIQLRMTLEEVVLASLVSNRQLVEDAQQSLTEKSFDKVFKKVRNLNPQFWPVGVEPVGDGEGTKWVNQSDVIQEGEVLKLHGKLSRLVHATNPYGNEVNLGTAQKEMREVVGKLGPTLNEHLVKLAGQDELLCCQVWADPVRTYQFKVVRPQA